MRMVIVTLVLLVTIAALPVARPAHAQMEPSFGETYYPGGSGPWSSEHLRHVGLGAALGLGAGLLLVELGVIPEVDLFGLAPDVVMYLGTTLAGALGGHFVWDDGRPGVGS